MKKFFTLLIMMACIVSTTWAYKEQSLDITVNGQKRNMICYTPNKVTEGMPLMIITHGMNQSPEYQRDGDKMYELIDTEKFIICYLRSDGNMWDTGGDKDMNFVSQTITEMKNKYAIDDSRVYWSGFSMGSMLIYHCMAKMANKIAAFAPTSGIQFSEQPWNALKSGNLKVNLIAHHSRQDEVFPIATYDVQSYVTNIANNTGCSKKTTTSNYVSKEGNYKGTKEVWVNPSTGNEVELFMYDGGGHWPSYYNRKEIWNFCKRFELMTPLKTYQKTYQRACDMVEYWANDPNVSSKSTYKTLKGYLTSKGPDKVDQTSDAKLKTATNSFNTAITNLENTIKTAVKTSPEVELTEFDPNLHVYLCFGQSNMEGNATPELDDYAIMSDRFYTMAAVNMSTHQRKMGHWYMARPPLCRDNTGLTPADYFGREMVKQLPDSIKVGVINVAIGGASINVFDDDKCEAYIAGEADWFKNYCASYDNHPYQRLVAMAKEAQKVGVIKGILLHQGCTDNGQKDWPERVKIVYDRLMNDLNLDPEDVPLLAGETLSQACGGVCWGHNSVIATLNKTIPNAHVVSSKNCPGASDGLHFTAEGYRMIGANYAEVMMGLLKPYMPVEGINAADLHFAKDTLDLQVGTSQMFKVYATDADGKTVAVNGNCVFTAEDPSLISFPCPVHLVTADREGETTITATITDTLGHVNAASAVARLKYFVLNADAFNPSLKLTGSFKENSTYSYFKSQKGGIGGWVYNQGIDLSNYRYLYIRLKGQSLAKPIFRIYDENNVDGDSYAEIPLQGKSEELVELSELKKINGMPLDLSHIYIAAFYVAGSASVNIYEVTLTNNSDPVGILAPATSDSEQASQWFDLSGRPIRGNSAANGQRANAAHGLLISKDKKVIMK